MSWLRCVGSVDQDWCSDVCLLFGDDGHFLYNLHCSSTVGSRCYEYKKWTIMNNAVTRFPFHLFSRCFYPKLVTENQGSEVYVCNFGGQRMVCIVLYIYSTLSVPLRLHIQLCVFPRSDGTQMFSLELGQLSRVIGECVYVCVHYIVCGCVCAHMLWVCVHYIVCMGVFCVCVCMWVNERPSAV